MQHQRLVVLYGRFARLRVLLQLRQGLRKDGHAAPRFVFDDEAGRIWGDDAVVARQFGDFVLQFGVFAVKPDFFEQISDASRCPQARNEIVLGR